MKFEDLPAAKKGKIGEEIVDNYLRSKGWIPYHCHEDGPHPFDRLIASKDKKEIYVADTKTKPSRIYYPDTGINRKNYDEYIFLQNKYGIRVFLFFVDEKRKQIYGNFLDVLDTEKKIYGEGEYKLSAIYPIEQETQKGVRIRYFPLSSMKAICRLDDEQVRMLCEHTTRNPEYEKKYEKTTDDVSF